jgi:hypothetical protein
MIDTSKCARALCLLVAPVVFAIAAPALAQAPTDAQRSAIRSACRSDYIAHCSSVPPGGVESLQCLQKNMSSLSSSCQTAVRAVEPAEAPKAEAAPKTEAAPKAEAAPKTETPPKAEAAPKAETPAKAESAPTAEPAKSKTEAATQAPKTAPATAAKKPSSAQVAAIRSACRSDYMKVCASVPPGGAAAVECLDKNKSKLSASCAQAVDAVAGGAKPATAGDAPPVAAPADQPAPVLVLRPMLPREELFVVRSACAGDVRALCQGVLIGGGRIVRCLAGQAASLSPGCHDALVPFAAQ